MDIIPSIAKRNERMNYFPHNMRDTDGLDYHLIASYEWRI